MLLFAQVIQANVMPVLYCVIAAIGTYMHRDGSYRLLRRPIQINTPLIRHTRIIRKRIFAILGGTLGLHQPPPNHHRIVPPASGTL
jgi:hypothetical protein